MRFPLTGALPVPFCWRSASSELNVCIIFLAQGVHPRYSLIVAANRDEFHTRPTLAAGFCQKSPWLLMGRDQQAGGTWLGLHQSGRFAAVTNMPLARESRLSRGTLPLNYLTGNQSPLDYVRSVQGERYQGFNLLAGTPETLCYLSNTGDTEADSDSLAIAPGLHGLTNRPLKSDTPKVQRGKTLLEPIISKVSISVDELLAVMMDTRLPAETDRSASLPGLEACFVTGERYGTRATTIILVSKDGQVQFTEQSWLAGGVRGPRNQFRCYLG